MKTSRVAKYIVFSAIIYTFFVCAAFKCWSSNDQQVIDFAGQKWTFPSTIGQALKEHKLDFRPPAYYYKNYPSGMEVIVNVNVENGDYNNESQPKEALFDRSVNSYIFRFPSSQKTYDSLRSHLENEYKSKFVLTRGRKDAKTLPESKMEFAYDLLKANEKLVIGIHKSETLVVVRYFYDVPLGKIGVKMGSYLSN